MESLRPPGIIKRIFFQEFTFGTAPFRVEGIAVKEDPTGIDMELDVRWSGDANITLGERARSCCCFWEGGWRVDDKQENGKKTTTTTLPPENNSQNPQPHLQTKQTNKRTTNRHRPPRRRRVHPPHAQSDRHRLRQHHQSHFKTIGRRGAGIRRRGHRAEIAADDQVPPQLWHAERRVVHGEFVVAFVHGVVVCSVGRVLFRVCVVCVQQKRKRTTTTTTTALNDKTPTRDKNTTQNKNEPHQKQQTKHNRPPRSSPSSTSS